MNSNLNFDIETESLLLAPDPHFLFCSADKRSVNLLLNHCESLVEDNSSVSSADPREYDICTPAKADERYKLKAEHKLQRFKSSVDKLVTKRAALREATEMLKLQVQQFLDTPLFSKQNLRNLNY